MAESYRGLTIRIGGDTSSLSRALKAANTAASQTSAELRKMGQALKLDPTSVKAFNAQLGYTSNQASNTAMKLKELVEARKALNDTDVVFKRVKGDEGYDKEIKKLKEIIELEQQADGLLDGEQLNVGQHFGSALSELNKVTASLDSAHQEMTGLVKEASKVERMKLKDAFDIAFGIKDAKDDLEELQKHYKFMPDGTLGTEERTGRMIEQVKALAAEIQSTFNLETGEFNEEAFEEILKKINEMPNGIHLTKKAMKQLTKSFGEAAKAANEAKEAAIASRGKELTDEQKAQVAELQAKRDEAASKEEQNQASLKKKIDEAADAAKKKQEEVEKLNEKDRAAIERLRSAPTQESAGTMELTEEQKAQVAELQAQRDKATADEARNQARIRQEIDDTAATAIKKQQEINRLNQEDAALLEKMKSSPAQQTFVTDETDADKEVEAATVALENLRAESKQAADSAAADMKRLEDATAETVSEIDDLSKRIRTFGTEGHGSSGFAAPKEIREAEAEYGKYSEIVERMTKEVKDKQAERAAASAKEKQEIDSLKAKLAELRETYASVEASKNAREAESPEKRDDSVLKQEVEQLRQYASEIDSLQKEIAEKEKERRSKSTKSGAETRRLNREIAEYEAAMYGRRSDFREREIEDLLKYADANDEATNSIIADYRRLEAEFEAHIADINSRREAQIRFLRQGDNRNNPEEQKKLYALDDEAGSYSDEFYPKRAELIDRLFEHESHVIDMLRKKREEASGIAYSDEEHRNDLIQNREGLEQRLADQRKEAVRLQEQESQRQIETAEQIAKAEQRVADVKNKSAFVEGGKQTAIDLDALERATESARQVEEVEGRIAQRNEESAAISAKSAENRLALEKESEASAKRYKETVSDIDFQIGDVTGEAVNVEAIQTKRDEIAAKEEQNQKALKQAIEDTLQSAVEEISKLEAEAASADEEIERINASEQAAANAAAAAEEKRAKEAKESADAARELADAEERVAAAIKDENKAYDELENAKTALDEVSTGAKSGSIDSANEDFERRREQALSRVEEAEKNLDQARERRHEAEIARDDAEEKVWERAFEAEEKRERAAEESADAARELAEAEEMVAAAVDEASDAYLELEDAQIALDNIPIMERLESIGNDDPRLEEDFERRREQAISRVNEAEEKYDQAQERRHEAEIARAAAEEKAREKAAAVEGEDQATDDDGEQRVRNAERLKELTEQKAESERKAAEITEKTDAELMSLAGKMADSATKTAETIAELDEMASSEVGEQGIVDSESVDNARQIEEIESRIAQRNEEAEQAAKRELDLRKEAEESAKRYKDTVSGIDSQIAEVTGETVDIKALQHERDEINEREKQNQKELEQTYRATAKAAVDSMQALAKENMRDEGIVKGLQNAPTSSTEEELYNAKRIEEVKSRIAERDKQMRAMAESAGNTLSGIYKEGEESSKKASDSISDINRQIHDAYGIDFGQILADSIGDVDKQIGKVVAEAFNNAAGNLDSDHIREVLNSIADDIALDPDKIEPAIADMERLSEKFVEAKTEFDKWKIITQFEDLTAEIIKGEAQLKNFSKMLSDLSVPSDLMRGNKDGKSVKIGSLSEEMPELTANIQYLEQAYQRLMSAGGNLANAFKADPSNIKLLESAMNSYAAASMVAVENSTRLQRQLQLFEKNGITEMEGGVRSAEQALFDAGKAADEAEQKFAEYDGELAQVRKAMTELGYTRGMSLTDKDVEDNFGESLKTIKEFKKEEEDLVAKRREAQQALRDARYSEDLAKQQVEYEKLRAKVDLYTKSVTDAYEAQTQLMRSDAVVSVTGDTSDLTQLENQIKSAADRAKAFKEALKLDPKNVELMTAKEQALVDVQKLLKQGTDALAVAMKKIDPAVVEQMRDKYGTVSSAVKATTDATKAYGMQLDVAKSRLADLVKGKQFDAIRSDVLNVGTAMKSSVIDKLGDSKDEVMQLRVAIATLGPAFEQAAQNMGDAAIAEAAERMQALQASMVKNADVTGKSGLDQAAFIQSLQQVSQYAERAGRAVVESANTIDTAYRNMRKTVDGTEEQFQSLHDEAVKFSQTHITSADTILEMEALGGQLGVSVDALQEFGKVAANLDIATDMEADDIALKLGQITNVMGDLDESTFENFADSLVRLGNNMAAQESSIMNVAQRMSSVANVAKMSTPELLAWSAAIASTGQRSESAATAVSNTITGIAAAVAKGGSDLQNFASIAGMSADQFTAAWNNTPSDALKAFVQGLQNLSESNTGAIEALENMGISSVRQETALLGLASTVDKLDEALVMSKEAFKGGGDAAIEAEKKSKGFSGSLGIMQNNLSNLAASLGEGLVGPMNVLASILTMLTDLLNGMHPAVKTVVTTLGGVAVVVGTVGPVLNQFIKGWKELKESSSAVSAAIKAVSTAYSKLNGILTGTGAAMEATAAEGEAAQGALSGTAVAGEAAGVGMKSAAAGTGLFAAALNAIPGMLVITAITAAVSALLGVIGDVTERMKLLDEAAHTAVSSAEAMHKAYAEAGSTDGIEKATKSLKQMREETNETLKSFAEHGKEMNEIFEKVGKNEAMADAYANQIKELGNQGHITAEDMKTLQNAVQSYNDLTGSSISIVDSLTGALNLNAQQLDEVTEAYKRRIEVEAYSDAYKKEFENLIEANQQLKETTAEMNKMTDEQVISIGNFKFMAPQAIGSAQELVDRFNALSDEMDRSKNRMDEYGKGMVSASTEAMSFEAAVTSAGMSIDSLSGLTDEQKQKLAEIQSALIAAGDSLKNYGSLNAEQIAKIIAAWRGGVPEIQKFIADLTSATQAGGTVDYEAMAKEHKKMREQQYNDTKRALDKEYKEVQKTYDAEYKAASKASQKYLKEFKAAQDEQVKAFKEATDARVKEIDREYEYKQSLLDKEYQGYDNGYDTQIDEIKAAQEAEDKAREQAEREKKLADLETEVAKAKGKKKAEALEKLHEYQEQLAYEDRKTARDEQIKSIQDQKTALKAQYDNRKEILKKSRDDAVESYKAQREKELEIMTKANEAEYEAEQEIEQAKLENMKAAQQEALEIRKESNDQALADFKETTEQQVANIKAGLTAEGEAIASAAQQTSSAVAQAAASTGASMEQMHQTAVNTAKSLLVSGKLSMEEYLNVMRQVPGSVGAIFSAVGITADNGVNQIAERLLQSGQITQEQYDAILAGIPGSTEAVFTEAGLIAAYQMGLIKEDALVKGTEAGVNAGEGIGSDQARAAAENGSFGLKAAAMNMLQSMPGEAEQISQATGTAASTLGGQGAVNNAAGQSKNIVDTVVETLKQLPGVSEIIGNNFIAGLIQGLAGVASLSSVGVAATAIGSTIINYLMRRLRENSPSKEAIEIGDYFGIGLVQGLDGTQRDIASSADDLGRTMLDAFDPSKLTVHADPVQEIIDSMRAREADLYAQSQKMAEIVERGFDPKIAIDAAYEAIDRIDAGTLKRQQLIASNQSVDNSTYAPVININIPEMVVREEADIDAISRQIATRVQRVMNSRLG